MSQTSQPIGSCIVVLNVAKTHVLLGKRKNSYKAGFFGLPGGRVEVGEDVQTAARRELLEETTLSPAAPSSDVFFYLGAVKEFQSDRDFVHFVFVCTLFEGTPTLVEPEKCEGWEWLSLDEVAQQSALAAQILPGHLAAIQLYLSVEGERSRAVSRGLLVSI